MDSPHLLRALQVFTGNMGTKTAPKITACKASDNWTCISFQPDLAKFDMTELEEDTVALMRKRVYDVAGVLGKGCKVCVCGGRGRCRLHATCLKLFDMLMHAYA